MTRGSRQSLISASRHPAAVRAPPGGRALEARPRPRPAPPAPGRRTNGACSCEPAGGRLAAARGWEGPGSGARPAGSSGGAPTWEAVGHEAELAGGSSSCGRLPSRGQKRRNFRRKVPRRSVGSSPLFYRWGILGPGNDPPGSPGGPLAAGPGQRGKGADPLRRPCPFGTGFEPSEALGEPPPLGNPKPTNQPK